MTPPSTPSSSPFYSQLSVGTQTPIPTTDCCPSAVVLQIQTAVLIPDYARFYSEPPSSFNPQYIPIEDGSLVTPVFASDIAHAYHLLFLLGLLAMLFFSNLVVSISYLCRTRVYNKALFRTLVLSQLLAFAGVVPMVLSFFFESVNCTAVILATYAAGFLSLALMMTGIYGVKVYKCLDNSVFVLVILVLFSCSIAAVAVLDLTRARGIHRISGSCTRSIDVSLTGIYLLLQFAQSLFVCFCFLYAVWKSRRSPVARRRLSTIVSMNESSGQDQQDFNEPQTGRRGWWDHVPTREPTPPSPHSDGSSITRSIRFFFSDLFTSKSDADLSGREHSVAGESSALRPPVTASDSGVEGCPKNSHPGDIRGRLSFTPSSFSNLSRYMPRMELFRNAMKDEVCYTATITACYVLVAVLSIVGINFTNGLPVTGWISLNWAVTSTLTVHSFGRVVRRQERDRYIQQAANWCSGGRAEGERSRTRAVSRHRTPYRRIRDVMGGQAVDQDNQFDETRALTQSCISWDSRFSHFHSPTSSEASSFVRSPSSQMLSIGIPSPTAQFPTASRRMSHS
ncbi:hypothetical protein VKT23_005667 [Stygiomarasmius scandens]|uniref:Uncharacterized protein n=1 Tax=Marasmiellus scandens TaxID=2682957 RepID=A0ABR1JRQ9_9AGAR